MASRLRYAVPLAFLAAASCSLLLDTESLQGGGGPGAGGITNDASLPDASTDRNLPREARADVVADAAADAEGGPKSCTSDYDCMAGTLDPCTQIRCVNQECQPPEPYKGPALAPVGDLLAVGISAESIGIPALAADDTGTVLAAYTRNALKTDVEIVLYPTSAINPAKNSLSTLLPSFSGFGATPGLLIDRTSGHVLHMLFPATAGDAGASAMHIVDFDLAPTALSVSDTQQTDPNVPVGAATAGLEKVTAPRLYATGQTSPSPPAIGMWIDNAALWVYDGTVPTAPAFTTRKVVAFAPLGAPVGVHAALQTLDDSNAVATELWTKDDTNLVALATASAGIPRGITATSADEIKDPRLNLVLWSKETALVPTMELGYVACTSTSDAASDPGRCYASSEQWVSTLPDGGTEPVYARWPAIASARPLGDPNARDVVEAFVIRYPTGDGQTSTSLLFLSAGRLTFGGGSVKGNQNLNPPLILVHDVTNSSTAPAGDAISLPAVSIGPTGQIIVAWIQHEKPAGALVAKDVLYAREFQVQLCGAARDAGGD